MSQNIAIARPYAKALFAIAKQTQRLDVWQQTLQVLGMLSADEQFRLLSHRPDVAAEDMLGMITRCVKQCVTLNDSETTCLQNLINILIAKKRLLVMAAIENLYLRELAKEQHVMNVEVTSAFALSDAQQSVMIEKLTSRFDSKVDVSFMEDNSLIGGAVIRAGTWVMDGSIRQKLNKLKDSMRG
jgi:F-type H+-transporting ATPase subunit delta